MKSVHKRSNETWKQNEQIYKMNRGIFVSMQTYRITEPVYDYEKVVGDLLTLNPFISKIIVEENSLPFFIHYLSSIHPPEQPLPFIQIENIENTKLVSSDEKILMKSMMK
jgi:hypothetical protein